MRRLRQLMLCAALAALFVPAGARAEFGLSNFDVTFSGPKGEPVTQAGSHPYQMNTTVHFDSKLNAKGGRELEELPKDVLLTQMRGFVGNPTAVPRCTTLQFLTEGPKPGAPDCPDASAVGTAAIGLASSKEVEGGHSEGSFYGAVYNLEPPPGKASRLGFWIARVPVTVELGVSESPPYSIFGGPTNISETVEVVSATISLWGNPTEAAHDTLRGSCFSTANGESRGVCPAGTSGAPFLTLPRACEGPLATSYATDSWQHPGAKLESGAPDLSDPNWHTGEALTHDNAEPPGPRGMSGCGKLGFESEISASPTSKAASSPSGLDFALDAENQGIENPQGISNADLEKAIVTLPEGFTVNPALAEGLEVCTEAQFEAETPYSAPGEGPNFAPPGVTCPEASKVGTVEVETPVLEERVLKGALYVAKPYENPFNSLIALYMVIKDPELGLVVTQPLKVVPDPVTGQLTTVAEELPPFPVSHFRLHFREGVRSPLVTPSDCGSYDGHDAAHEPIRAILYPSSGNAPVEVSSSFEIISGSEGSPCPSGGLPPFKPGLIAGTLNNRAGSFSPFNLRLFRSDSEQEITHFSIKLPPGISGKLAGIPYCPDAAIEAAKARTGPHGGQEELDSPSCPAASQIGRTLAGAGVGPALAYAPGKVYLAGPYHGSPLSMVAITAGVVGPFDIGTVVVREAFKINPETAEVFIDSQGSDPIPHIIRGIPVHLRDIRAYVDRPEFVLNPTDCSPTSTASTVLGSGLDFVSEADDNPITVSSHFQAADCAALSFAPQLSLRLIGGTKRGKLPRLVSHLQMNGIGEAGIDHAQVVLPHSEFIESEHFNTLCTRVQFKEGAGNGSNCPAGSIYGHAKAVTPILAEPLEGPVMLRSNPERKLPDVVAALHNAQVDFDLVGNVDSVKGKLRTTFATAPDAPVTSFDLQLEGGSKGLFINSEDLCLKKHRAQVSFAGQNGKEFSEAPLMGVKCKGKAKKHKRHRARHKRQARRASR